MSPYTLRKKGSTYKFQFVPFLERIKRKETFQMEVKPKCSKQKLISSKWEPNALDGIYGSIEMETKCPFWALEQSNMIQAIWIVMNVMASNSGCWFD